MNNDKIFNDNKQVQGNQGEFCSTKFKDIDKRKYNNLFEQFIKKYKESNDE